MDDLISRQAAIDEVDEWIKAFRENGHKESAADACLIQDGIIQLPSAGPKKGEWLPDDADYYEERFVCSICGRSYRVDTCMGDPTWDFCPGCGADMREEEQDD